MANYSSNSSSSSSTSSTAIANNTALTDTSVYSTAVYNTSFTGSSSNSRSSTNNVKFNSTISSSTGNFLPTISPGTSAIGTSSTSLPKLRLIEVAIIIIAILVALIILRWVSKYKRRIASVSHNWLSLQLKDPQKEYSRFFIPLRFIIPFCILIVLTEIAIFILPLLPQFTDTCTKQIKYQYVGRMQGNEYVLADECQIMDRIEDQLPVAIFNLNNGLQIPNAFMRASILRASDRPDTRCTDYITGGFYASIIYDFNGGVTIHLYITALAFESEITASNHTQFDSNSRSLYLSGTLAPNYQNSISSSGDLLADKWIRTLVANYQFTMIQLCDAFIRIRHVQICDVCVQAPFYILFQAVIGYAQSIISAFFLIAAFFVRRFNKDFELPPKEPVSPLHVGRAHRKRYLRPISPISLLASSQGFQPTFAVDGQTLPASPSAIINSPRPSHQSAVPSPLTISESTTSIIELN